MVFVNISVIKRLIAGLL